MPKLTYIQNVSRSPIMKLLDFKTIAEMLHALGRSDRLWDGGGVRLLLSDSLKACECNFESNKILQQTHYFSSRWALMLCLFSTSWSLGFVYDSTEGFTKTPHKYLDLRL